MRPPEDSSEVGAVRILAGLVFALAIPFALCAQDGVVVSYDGYAGFQGPLWAQFLCARLVKLKGNSYH